MVTVHEYLDKKDREQMIKILRRNPLDKTPHIIHLGGDIYIKTTLARCLVNAYIFDVLDSYNLKDDETRRKCIFTSDYSKGAPARYRNELLDIARSHPDFELKEVFLPHFISDIVSCFYLMAIIVNGIVSTSHDLVDYLEAFEEHPELRDYARDDLYTKHTDPYTVDRLGKEGIALLKRVKIKPIHKMMQAGIKAKDKQILMAFHILQVPSWLNPGEVMPNIVSGFLNGINNIYDLYCQDMISILAIISGKVEVKTSGFLSKKIGIVLSDIKANKPDTREMLDDCGNNKYLWYKIENEKDLRYTRYKYFYDPITHEKLGYVDIDRTDLIGKTIFIRSIALCAGEVLCKECIGYNWNYLSDTALYKVNLNTFVLTDAAKAFQAVISIKHACSANLKQCIVEYNGVKMPFMDFVNNSGVIENLNFNALTVKKDCKLTYVYDEDKGYRVFIDGIEFITEQPLSKIASNIFGIIIPNDSPLLRAQDLEIAINSHSPEKATIKKKKKKYKPGNIFDAASIKDIPIEHQVRAVYDFIKPKVDFDHILQYECLIHALCKDSDDLSTAVSYLSKNLTFTHASNALTKPDRSKKISTKIIHGYITQTLKTIRADNAPDEYDIIYNPIEERRKDKTTINEALNNVILQYDKEKFLVQANELSDDELYMPIDGNTETEASRSPI